MTLNELRVLLSEEILKIREGQTTAANVNAITNATGKILSTVKLEMEYYKMTGKPLPDIPMLTQGKELEVKKPQGKLKSIGEAAQNTA
jgi:hypothetical protein